MLRRLVAVLAATIHEMDEERTRLAGQIAALKQSMGEELEWQRSETRKAKALVDAACEAIGLEAAGSTFERATACLESLGLSPDDCAPAPARTSTPRTSSSESRRSVASSPRRCECGGRSAAPAASS